MLTVASTTPTEITRAVVASFDRSESERLRQVIAEPGAAPACVQSLLELNERAKRSLRWA